MLIYLFSALSILLKLRIQPKKYMAIHCYWRNYVLKFASTPSGAFSLHCLKLIRKALFFPRISTLVWAWGTGIQYPFLEGFWLWLKMGKEKEKKKTYTWDFENITSSLVLNCLHTRCLCFSGVLWAHREGRAVLLAGLKAPEMQADRSKKLLQP